MAGAQVPNYRELLKLHAIWHWSLRRPPHPISSSLVIPPISALGKTFLNHLTNTKVYNIATLENLILNRGERPLISYCNHASTVDDPALFGLLPWKILLDVRGMRWSLGASEICFTNDVFSAFFKAGKVLATTRGKGIHQGSMEKALEKLNNNEWVHVFPEAKIVQEPGLDKFRWGIARLIMESKTPPLVLPFWHRGMDKVMPENRLLKIPIPGNNVDLLFAEKPLDFANDPKLRALLPPPEEFTPEFRAKERELYLSGPYADVQSAEWRKKIINELWTRLDGLRIELDERKK
ncbi:acyltransferase-domain-containing protein [Cladochytrium replicatum]|nr:acyltransferase-domain-containing protein [Cladochytrium replicatum]